MPKNLTLAIEEDLLLAARKLALDRGTSVNQLVREYLRTLVDSDGRRRRARASLKKAFAKEVGEVGEGLVIDWKREDLYER